MILDNFDNLTLSGPKIYCTYCWQSHWQSHFGAKLCGPDNWRYLDNKSDYLAYIRQYLTNGGEHSPLGQEQLRLL
jgi:hypothetical protein